MGEGAPGAPGGLCVLSGATESSPGTSPRLLPTGGPGRSPEPAGTGPGECAPAGRTARAEGLRIREGRGTGGSGRSFQENGKALLPDVSGGPCRAGASVTEGRRGPYLQTRPRRSCRRFRVVFLVNSGASCFSASKIPFGKMDISGRFSGKTQNVILILDQNYRKHIPGFSGDWESVETGRFPGAGLKEK